MQPTGCPHGSQFKWNAATVAVLLVHRCDLKSLCQQLQNAPLNLQGLERGRNKYYLDTNASQLPGMMYPLHGPSYGPSVELHFLSVGVQTLRRVEEKPLLTNARFQVRRVRSSTATPLTPLPPFRLRCPTFCPVPHKMDVAFLLQLLNGLLLCWYGTEYATAGRLPQLQYPRIILALWALLNAIVFVAHLDLYFALDGTNLQATQV